MTSYLYTYTYHEDEQQLCELELRTLFPDVTVDIGSRWFRSALELDPSRSPFIHQQLSITIEASDLSLLIEQVSAHVDVGGATFKVQFIKLASTGLTYDEQRSVERQIGAVIRGQADMRQPERVFGVAFVQGRWLFGGWQESAALWLQHQNKPQHYSTALSTRVARAVVNIAIPAPQGIRAIDPCCGIGTVLIEALSMGIDMVGRDINPLAVRGARANLAHFHFPNVITLGDMQEITEHYDTAIIDMPYNLCSKLSAEDQQAMLIRASQFATRVIIVTAEPIDTAILQAGLQIQDRCQVRKGTFIREVIVTISA